MKYVSYCILNFYESIGDALFLFHFKAGGVFFFLSRLCFLFEFIGIFVIALGSGIVKKKRDEC